MQRTDGFLRVLLVSILLSGSLSASAQPAGAPKGKLVLAWHTSIASKWLDPQEHDGTATPDNFLNALHDALIKNSRDTLFDHPGLAERYEFAADARSATFWLRPGITFHNGAPVTVQDVKFSFEHYRGARADLLKSKTERVEIVDERTVRFHFKEPFLDFPIIFGTSNVCGAGWIVPAKYYQEVGPDGFKQKPIGAGPYKLVHQEAGTRLEFEAFAGYYRPVHTKQLVMISVPEAVTRMAMLERGEADLAYLVPGEFIERLTKNPRYMLAPVLSGSWWLEFPGFQDPKNPFHDKRVRQAVSLAVDRQAINEAEMGGFGKNSGNWINSDVQYAIEWPTFEHNLEQARQLLREAGYPNGFEVDWLTPVPTYYSRGEAIVVQLSQVGIRAKLQVMERAAFLQKLQGGLKEWPGVQIIFNSTRVGGTWANWYDAFFKCGSFNGRDRHCIKELDEKFVHYEHSTNPAERQALAAEIQRTILEQAYFVPIFRHAFLNVIGPRIAAQRWQDVFPTITTGYAYPWEDIKLKE
ncbi:MAG: ABC transporter substrate-binding protein [Candidatus Tectimicrobiota bacterium]